MAQSTWVPDQEFYAALGAAIANWQEVESALSYLFRSALRHPDYAQAAEVFYSVQNFRDKLRMVDATIRYAMSHNPEFLASWEKLRVKINKRSLRRNEIAHGYVWHFTRKDTDAPLKEYIGPSTSLPSSVGRTLDGGPNKLIDKTRLQATTKSFDLLLTRISACRRELDARLTRLLEAS